MAKKKIYRFTGKEGSFLPERQMKEWIQKHQDYNEVRGHFFGKEILVKILDQPGCVGIRFYHAIDDNGQKTLVLVGADSKGSSMWPSTTRGSGKLKDGGGGTGDTSRPCPPYC
jgi:hypothetical protein